MQPHTQPIHIPHAETIRRATDDLKAQIAAEQAQRVPYFDSTAAVTDMNITPFLRAMRDEGYPAKLSASGCLVDTKACSDCRAKSVFAFAGPAGDFEMCVYCAIKKI